MHILILGAGIAGTSLSIPLHANQHKVTVAGNFMEAEKVSVMQETCQHPSPAFALPQEISITHWQEAKQAFNDYTHLIIAVSSAGLPWAISELTPLLSKHPIPFLLVAKGVFATETDEIIPLLEQTLPQLSAEGATIAGPMLCQELANSRPTAITLAGHTQSIVAEFQQLLQTEWLYVHGSDDVLGVSWCAALKNIYALTLGIYAGVQEAQGQDALNSRAALFSQASQEMAGIAQAVGGDPFTAIGLAGIGDLYVTEHGGRNGKFGRLLGLGHSLEDAHTILPVTVESIKLLQTYGHILENKMEAGTLPKSPLLSWAIEIVCHKKSAEIGWHTFFL